MQASASRCQARSGTCHESTHGFPVTAEHSLAGILDILLHLSLKSILDLSHALFEGALYFIFRIRIDPHRLLADRRTADRAELLILCDFRTAEHTVGPVRIRTERSLVDSAAGRAEI